MPNSKYVETMLFDYGTTNKTDYRDGRLLPIIKTEYEAKPQVGRAEAGHPPLRDVHTLSEWKDARVPPFTLYYKPKDIVRTNPRHAQQPYYEEEENANESERVRKTRPRLVMTPAVSMDDIEDPVARKILCTETYTSVTERAMRESAALPSRTKVKAPLPELPAPANPFVLPKVRPSLVSPEWRMETLSWDTRQLRAFCNPTADFWLRREPAKCIKCDEAPLVTACGKMLMK